MPQFDDKSIARISRTVRGWEARLKSQRQHRGRWQGGNTRVVFFELLETLTQWSGTVVQAARREWDPNEGTYGAWVTDCTDIILVGDLNNVGHNAGVGGFGCAVLNARSDGTLIGTIIDLCCPGDEKGVCP